jgi:probable dihydroxyacetone kinase regulator
MRVGVVFLFASPGIKKEKTMADSNITKKALANSLKELVSKIPMGKIGIGDICENCEMNRKSFYYHFKDKNDLINWIFDSEFSLFVKEERTDPRSSFQKLLVYLYANKAFYGKVLGMKDQNCLCKHLKEHWMPYIKTSISENVDAQTSCFFADFVTDAVIFAVEKWLTQPDNECAESFYAKLEKSMQLAAQFVCGEKSASV